MLTKKAVVISENRKKTLIEKIREHRRNKTMKQNISEKNVDFKNEFNDSMNYLNNLELFFIQLITSSIPSSNLVKFFIFNAFFILLLLPCVL